MPEYCKHMYLHAAGQRSCKHEVGHGSRPTDDQQNMVNKNKNQKHAKRTKAWFWNLFSRVAHGLPQFVRALQKDRTSHLAFFLRPHTVIQWTLSLLHARASAASRCWPQAAAQRWKNQSFPKTIELADESWPALDFYSILENFTARKGSPPVLVSNTKFIAVYINL